jgi:hypothetical protein
LCRLPAVPVCEIAEGETIERQLYFKANHIELVLGAAGLTDSPIDQAPAAVAGAIERTARSIGAPFQTAADLRIDAEKEVDKIIDRVKATNQAGGLHQLNKAYKIYRQQQIDRAERAISYNRYLEEKYTLRIIRSVASVGRMVA